MKITFHPTKASVLNKLAIELKAAQSAMDEEKAALAASEEKASESKLHNPYLDQEILGLKAKVKHWETQEATLHDLIGCIESDPEEHLTAEVEV